MDTLDEKLKFTVTKGDKTFTFRRPTSRQLLGADVLASRFRENIPVNSLSYGFVLSDMIASLNTFVIEPKDFDFGELYGEEVGEIHQEVSKWLNTFHSSIPVSK